MLTFKPITVGGYAGRICLLFALAHLFVLDSSPAGQINDTANIQAEPSTKRETLAKVAGPRSAPPIPGFSFEFTEYHRPDYWDSLKETPCPEIAPKDVCYELSDDYIEYDSQYREKEIAFREFLTRMNEEKRVFFLHITFLPFQIGAHVEGNGRWLVTSLFTDEPFFTEGTTPDNRSYYGPILIDTYDFSIAIEIPSNRDGNGWSQFDVTCTARETNKLTGFYRIQYEMMTQGQMHYAAYLVPVDNEKAEATYRFIEAKTPCT